LERTKTVGGICPVIIGQRPTLDAEPRGQFDQVVGVLQAHIRLMAMVLDYSDQAVYCLGPTTKVLTEDLEYVEVGKLAAGDKLVGFDEFPSDGTYRRWRSAEVIRSGRAMLPSYQVKLADGTEFTASSDHKWLVSNAGHASTWVPTWKLEGMFHTAYKPRIVKPLDMWEHDKSWESGYLSGVLDGEGWLSANGSSLRLGIAQRENECLAQTERALAKFGFSYNKTVMSGSVNNPGGPVYNLQLQGGMREIVRLLMTVRPERLIAKFHKLGGAEAMGRFKRHEIVEVTECEFIGDAEVVTLATSTGTLVAEGYAHHNSDIWVKDLIGQMPYGGGAVIQLGPNGSIGRVQPAVSSLQVQQELDSLVNNIHLGGRWPKSRPGEIDQSIASAKYLESAAGMMNTVIRTMHLVNKRALEQALRVCFKQDLESGKPRMISGILKNQQFLEEHDRKLIDPKARLRVDYGIGLGRDPAQTMVLGIQGMQTGLFSKEFVQENFEGLTDVSRERERIDVEMLKDMAFAKIQQGIQDGSIPSEALVQIAKKRSKGDDIFDVFEEFIVKPAQAQQEQMVQPGLPGAQPMMPGANPAEAGMMPPPSAPPPEELLAGMLGAGPGGPPKMIARTSVPTGPGSFAGIQSGG
jgi:hypothetical protein